MKLTIHRTSDNPAHQDINSHSVERRLLSQKGLDASEVRRFAQDAVRAAAYACDAAGAKDVSHVKLFLEHATGFVHASAVGIDRDATVEGHDGGAAHHFRLVMNAVIYGLPPDVIRSAVEQALEGVQTEYRIIASGAAKSAGGEAGRVVQTRLQGDHDAADHDQSGS